MSREYVIVNGRLYMKIDGDMVDFPDPIPAEIQGEIDAVWKEYDKQGASFISYHKPGKP